MARVLVADDEPKLGRFVSEMLELDGRAVRRATGRSLGRDGLLLGESGTGKSQLARHIHYRSARRLAPSSRSTAHRARGYDEIRAEHLATAPVAARTRAVDSLLVEGFELDAHERSLVHAAIERAGGNKSRAPKLGITRRRLHSLLASFGDLGV